MLLVPLFILAKESLAPDVAPESSVDIRKSMQGSFIEFGRFYYQRDFLSAEVSQGDNTNKEEPKRSYVKLEGLNFEVGARADKFEATLSYGVSPFLSEEASWTFRTGHAYGPSDGVLSTVLVQPKSQGLVRVGYAVSQEHYVGGQLFVDSGTSENKKNNQEDEESKVDYSGLGVGAYVRSYYPIQEMGSYISVLGSALWGFFESELQNKSGDTTNLSKVEASGYQLKLEAHFNYPVSEYMGVMSGFSVAYLSETVEVVSEGNPGADASPDKVELSGFGLQFDVLRFKLML